MKNKNGGGEPGIDSHAILWHDNITAIIAKVVTQLCKHMIGSYSSSYGITTENVATLLVRPQYGSNSSNGRKYICTQCVSKALPIYCYDVLL